MNRQHWIKLTFITLTLSIAASCNKDRTEILLGMATDLAAPAPLSSVEVQIFNLSGTGDAGLLADQPLSISGMPNQVYELPGTFAVYSASGAADRFRAVLTATDDAGNTLVVRSAVMNLVPEKTLFVRLGLVSACAGAAGQCGTGQTCIEGRCATEDVDSSLLPPYVAGLEGRVECTNATNFVDTSTRQPLMVSGTSCSAGSCLEGICLAPAKNDAGAGGTSGTGTSSSGGGAGSSSIGTGTGGTGAGGGGGAGTTGTTGGAGTNGATGGAGTNGRAGTAGTASVLQHHNDLARDGLYVDAALTKTAAASMQIDATFANATVQGNVYAQPLYLAGNGTKPDEVIVATEQNRVQAFNAANGASVWAMSLGTPVTTGLPCGVIASNGGLGVTGTPVIDGTNRIIYLDAMTSSTQPTHMIHALNADTGAEQLGWPVNVDQTATQASGGTQFTSMYQNQRGALTLVGGKVFVPYGGHQGECGGYHGWLVGVTATTNPQVTAWATRAVAGGVWGASGIASDGTSLFFATGNSKSSASAGPNTSSGDANGAWGDSETVFKFPTTLAAPAMTITTDYFLPGNWVGLDDGDQDIGGSAPILVNVPGATPSALIVALGKDTNAYLLNRANLGGMDATPLAEAKVLSTANIVSAFASYTTPNGTYVVFKGAGATCPAGQSGGLTALKISSASPPSISTAWCAGPTTVTSPAVSQTDGNGSNTVVWAVTTNGQLYALDGDAGTTLLTPPAAAGALQSIQTPIIANGRIFVATNTKVVAFKPTAAGN